MLSFVIGRNDWREYDQIVSLYTLELGKVEVLARGVKKILSKNSSFLEPGNLVEAEVIPGKELNHLGSVQIVNGFSGLRKSEQGNAVLSFSLYIFSNFITHQERDERVFKLLYSWLDFLDNNKIGSAVFSLDVFIVKFLAVLGFDISVEEKVGKEIKKDLELVIAGNWEIINRLKFEGDEVQILHDIVYQFCLYHVQKKINDWAKLAYFSGK
jgi:DNA repair protein RecO (recombination protein O)